MDINLNNIRAVLVEEVLGNPDNITDEEKDQYGRKLVIHGKMPKEGRRLSRTKKARIGITHALGNAAPDTYTMSVIIGKSTAGESRIFYADQLDEDKIRKFAQKIIEHAR